MFNQGKLVKTVKIKDKWVRIGKIKKSFKKPIFTIVTDNGIYDAFGSLESAINYANDYVNGNLPN